MNGRDRIHRGRSGPGRVCGGRQRGGGSVAEQRIAELKSEALLVAGEIEALVDARPRFGIEGQQRRSDAALHSLGVAKGEAPLGRQPGFHAVAVGGDDGDAAGEGLEHHLGDALGAGGNHEQVHGVVEGIEIAGPREPADLGFPWGGFDQRGKLRTVGTVSDAEQGLVAKEAAVGEGGEEPVLCLPGELDAPDDAQHGEMGSKAESLFRLRRAAGGRGDAGKVIFDGGDGGAGVPAPQVGSLLFVDGDVAGDGFKRGSNEAIAQPGHAAQGQLGGILREGDIAAGGYAGPAGGEEAVEAVGDSTLDEHDEAWAETAENATGPQSLTEDGQRIAQEAKGWTKVEGGKGDGGFPERGGEPGIGIGNDPGKGDGRMMAKDGLAGEEGHGLVPAAAGRFAVKDNVRHCTETGSAAG